MLLFQSVFYFLLIGTAIVSSIILRFELIKSDKKLPVAWRNSFSLRNLTLSISFLTIFLLCNLTTEFVSQYLAKQHIYNSFIFSFDFTISSVFLFGFLYKHTQTVWKQYTYLLLYIIIIAYLINGGYYHPKCILPGTSALLIYSIYFIAALLHLTDLLLNPKSDYFKLQLKINLSFSINMLIASIATSFQWSLDGNENWFEIYFQIQFINMMLFYFSLALIFISEILKLRRK
ncbi:MAG: hypothetical protein K0S23_1284 [Fluviicola sp.]|jgi:hypothetical protein|uniref:hypothetical protein n=1 Tax=Fluviicola sp. TaxID=1917219 RepID=UPI00260CCE9C|nr:hypothetical protein [Fluviicola sp.]MDF3026977.1 hypothetical protein [Fluviicola sp.]